MSKELVTVQDNKLLSMVPGEDLVRLEAELEPLALPRGTMLGQTGKPIDYVYFLTDGLASVVARTPENRQTEAGIFGREGYVPSSAIAGADVHSFDISMQFPGKGYRLTYATFQRAMEDRAFARIMIRAIEAFAIQLAYTAVSNAVHDVNVRLARWLLMCHDRVTGNELPLVHDFISLMLAVRRPSVTTSLHVLEGNGFIRADRGLITIRNRSALEEFAFDAYGEPEKGYRRLMNSVDK